MPPADGTMKGKYMKKPVRAFTAVEILIAISILMILISIVFVMLKGVDTKTKITKVQMQTKTLGDAVDAFKQATGKYPLAVPYDAWASDTNWNAFTSTTIMKWTTTWRNYFKDADSNSRPDFKWGSNDNPDKDPKPTDIQMLTFQLDQVPSSAKVLTQIRNQANQDQQVEFVPDTKNKTDSWEITSEFCEIAHPLDGDNVYRKTFQPLDPWGTPLRFWTGDILKWAKEDTAKTKWSESVRTLLSEKLQKANWGFIIESAGPDRYFGWYGATSIEVKTDREADNIYSTE
jgi:type II secretory pathway pseudopilin PulG